jgi:hypothetical protein
MRAPATVRYVAPPPAGVNNPGCLSPCATINYAISQSGYGDRINVASGIYTEHITTTNGVSVHGTDWLTTIITGNSPQPTHCQFSGGIDATTVLSGVRVSGGGNGNPATSSNGSGIRITGGSSPQIINTWLYSNTSQRAAACQ